MGGGPAAAGDDGRWQFEDVCAALPQVYPATREQFLPQALNLDALDGISFEKGCYVGQEVVARQHFRGGPRKMLCGLIPAGAVRQGDSIWSGERKLGVLTTVLSSPTVGGSIALAVLMLSNGGVLSRLAAAALLEDRGEGNRAGRLDHELGAGPDEAHRLDHSLLGHGQY